MNIYIYTSKSRASRLAEVSNYKKRAAFGSQKQVLPIGDATKPHTASQLCSLSFMMMFNRCQLDTMIFVKLLNYVLFMMMFSRCQLHTMIFVKLCFIYDDVQQVPTGHNDLC